MLQLFDYKSNKCLLQIASGFLLQNATFVLQNVAVITKCEDFITICDSYYKMQRLLQIAIVHPLSLSQNVTLVHSFYLHKH